MAEPQPQRQVLVTGGARGIGAATARAFAARGFRVVVADVLDDEGTRLAAELGGGARYRHLDVTDEGQWRAIADDLERYGPLDVLVNNAGVVEFGTIEDTAPKAFQRVLDVNLLGPWLGMHVLGSALRAGHGAVVNVSSTAGLMGYSNVGAYVASKWGLRGLTKTAALEFASDGVRVCSVHPGPIATPMTAGLGDALVAGQPLPRYGDADEVARMIVFVAEDATFSTGSEFTIDGGATTGSGVVADVN